jgi:hypothetical protein
VPWRAQSTHDSEYAPLNILPKSQLLANPLILFSDSSWLAGLETHAEAGIRMPLKFPTQFPRSSEDVTLTQWPRWSSLS